MRTLLIDNYDSFTYNLYQLLGEVNGQPPVVVRNDADWAQLDDRALRRRRHLAGARQARATAGLRHQRPRDPRERAPAARRLPRPPGASATCFGGAVEHAPRADARHASRRSSTPGLGIFQGLPSPFAAVRYHSLAVADVPAELEVVAWTEDDVVMGLRHRSEPLWGVQFHPESICREYGRELLANFRDLAGEHRSGRRTSGAPGPRRRATGSTSARSTVLPDAELAHRELFSADEHRFWLDIERGHRRPLALLVHGRRLRAARGVRDVRRRRGRRHRRARRRAAARRAAASSTTSTRSCASAPRPCRPSCRSSSTSATSAASATSSRRETGGDGGPSAPTPPTRRSSSPTACSRSTISRARATCWR